MVFLSIGSGYMGAADSKEAKIQFVQHMSGQSEERMSGSITFLVFFTFLY